MKKNKKIREQLEKQYGKGCMFEKAKIEEKIKKIKEIKTYKKFIGEKNFTGRILNIYKSQMNLHHLKHRAEGGETSIENGAVVSTLAHIYLHSLPREQEEFINNELREYKRQVDDCRIVFDDNIEVPYTIKAVEFSVNEKGKYNRAKKLKEDKKMIKEWEDSER